MGDDSQRDMEVYADIAKEYDNRIIKVYIRQTRPKVFSYQKRLWERLQSTGVPVEYFKDDKYIDVDVEFQQLENACL